MVDIYSHYSRTFLLDAKANLQGGGKSMKDYRVESILACIGAAACGIIAVASGKVVLMGIACVLFYTSSVLGRKRKVRDEDTSERRW